jgi:uncharacterized protein YuzE
MEISYDKKADALNIVLKKGKVAKTVELALEVNLDLDKAGKPLYLEIIGASEKIGRKQASEFTLRGVTAAITV